MNNKLNIRYLYLVLLGVVILGILAVSVGYGLVREDNITFIDDVNTGNQEINENSSANKLELRYSKEYRSWKNTADTSFASLFNGNQAVDLLAERPNLVILWAGYAFSKRGHPKEKMTVPNRLPAGPAKVRMRRV